MDDSFNSSELRQVCEEAVKLGAKLIKTNFLKNGLLTVNEKNTGDFVTNIDLDSEKIIRNKILESYPKTQILGEEQGILGEKNNLIWFIDPLDGTGAFIRGNYAFVAVSVAVANSQTKKVLAGAICNPFTDILYSADKDKDCSIMNGSDFVAPLSPKLDNARILIDFSSQLPQSLQRNLCEAEVDKKIGRILRYDGSIAQHICLIAKGALHGGLFWGIGNGKGSYWDIGAAQLICTQAGLKITDLDRNEITYSNKVFDQIIIGSPQLHDQLYEWVTSLKLIS